MDAMTVFTIIGTVATIAGAVISYWQARVSQTAAKDARKIRAELIDHRKASELAQIQTVCRKAQKSMEKYGPSSTPSSLAGVSPEKDAQDVQEFILLLMENRAHFENSDSNDADEFCDKTNRLLDKFVQSQGIDMKKVGSQILLSIGSIASVIKKLVDAKREELH